MTAETSAQSARPPLMAGIDAIWPAATVAAAYYAGAQAVLAIAASAGQTLVPIWPPSVVLFCAFVVVPAGRWWLFALAALPAHMTAELQAGIALPQVVVAFAATVLAATFSAFAVRRLLKRPPWFASLHKTSLYIAITVLVGPALGALAGALGPVVAGLALADYPTLWARWYAANALASVAIGPIALIAVSEGVKNLAPAALHRQVEAAILAAALVIVCAVVLKATAGRSANALDLVLLYAPLPLIIWAAARFGVKGASGTILVVTAVVVWRMLAEPAFFAAGAVHTKTLVTQVYLIGLAIPLLLLGASIDDTRNAERSTRESEARMASAAASANIGLWHYDIAADVFWGSAACRALFGMRKDGALARDDFLAAIHPDDRLEVTHAFRTALHAGQSIAIEFRVGAAGAEPRWLLVRGQGEGDELDQPVRVSGVFLDVTLQRKAEADAELQRRELAHLTRVSMLGELSGTIAHELHQPLTAILSNAQAVQNMLAQGGGRTGEVREALEDIVSEGNRAGEVIHRLRKLLRKDEGKLEPVEVSDLVRSTLRLLHGELVSRNVRVKVQLAEDLPQPTGDLVQLQQVVLNLVMNGMDAMAAVPVDRRVITLRSRRVGQKIELTVSDRGRGIPPDHQAALFQPFFSTKEHGLGLGLSICSTIVKSHGGELFLMNNREGGATAIVRLPVNLPQAEAQDEREWRSPEAAVSGLHRG